MTRGSSMDTPATDPSKVIDPFPPGAPQVAIGSLSIDQAAIQQHLPAGQRVASDQALRFHMYCTPGIAATENPAGFETFFVFADLQITHDRWFLGVTASATILFRDPASAPTQDADGANGLVQSIGPWAAHPLYDFAAVSGRALIATTFGCTIEIPATTPAPHLAQIARKAPNA